MNKITMYDVIDNYSTIKDQIGDIDLVPLTAKEIENLSIYQFENLQLFFASLSEEKKRKHLNVIINTHDINVKVHQNIISLIRPHKHDVAKIYYKQLSGKEYTLHEKLTKIKFMSDIIYYKIFFLRTIFFIESYYKLFILYTLKFSIILYFEMLKFYTTLNNYINKQ